MIMAIHIILITDEHYNDNYTDQCIFENFEIIR